ncbi:hypothetical protein GCM10012275_64380 [Longimycelium tulufanense]|uniref:TetR family transcriptional regulator n=1 Tax=Longimycelium tulufanense TaxID=907463 RepID=A0A8J3CL01_9PSEU|nr:hypothetical protein [Longimycelium tulufanense]GGM84779.1 hypothetical protein GCM10012275_64380 [Longimycelium tulufanense]
MAGSVVAPVLAARTAGLYGGDELVAAVVAAPDPAASWGEQIRSAIRAVTEVPAHDPRKARVKLIEVIGAGPCAEERRQRGLRAFADLLLAWLPPAAVQRGIDPDTLAVGLVAAANELFVGWIGGHLDLDRERLVEHIALLIEATANQIAGDDSPLGTY